MQLFAFAHLKSSVSRGSDLSSRLCFLALRRQGSNESTNSLPNTRTTILRNNDQTNLDSAFIRLLDFCLNLGGGGLSLSASLCLAYLSESAYHERICLYARADPRYLNSPLILLLVFTLSSLRLNNRETLGTFGFFRFFLLSSKETFATFLRRTPLLLDLSHITLPFFFVLCTITRVFFFLLFFLVRYYSNIIRN